MSETRTLYTDAPILTLVRHGIATRDTTRRRPPRGDGVGV